MKLLISTLFASFLAGIVLWFVASYLYDQEHNNTWLSATDQVLHTRIVRRDCYGYKNCNDSVVPSKYNCLVIDAKNTTSTIKPGDTCYIPKQNTTNRQLCTIFVGTCMDIYITTGYPLGDNYQITRTPIINCHANNITCVNDALAHNYTRVVYYRKNSPTIWYLQPGIYDTDTANTIGNLSMIALVVFLLVSVYICAVHIKKSRPYGQLQEPIYESESVSL
jgi:hypothetical protein